MNVMIREEGKAWPFASRGVEKDIRPAIIETLRAAIEIGRAFGIGYFNMLLRGAQDTKYLKPAHVNSLSYGALASISREAISRVFHYMVDEGLLASPNDSYATFTITDKGRNFLESPTDVYVQGTYLKVTARESFMYQRLRAFRKAVAEKQQTQEYQVYTDFTMDRVVMRNPETALQLSALPGMNAFKLDAFGEELLNVVQEGLKEYREVAYRRNQYFNSKPDHQYVKKLVDENKTFAEICKSMTYEYARVENILVDLSETQDLNVISWIEAHVSSKQLFRGTEFFRAAKTRDIHQARETLQLDYPTLHLSRLYVKVMEGSREAVKQAG